MHYFWNNKAHSCLCVCVQVLCKESVWASRCYWEVLYSGWVVVGAAYEGAARKAGDGPCGLGENEESWGLGWAGSCYDAWHKGINSRVADVPQCCTIGVYVDQPAGLLCFYTVETEEDSKKKEVKLLHRFKNPIKEKILPGFWVGRQSSCLILKKEEWGRGGGPSNKNRGLYFISHCKTSYHHFTL